MAQSGSSSSRKSSGRSTRSAGSSRTASSARKSSSSARKSSSSARRSSSSRSKSSAAARREAAKKGGRARGRQQTARKRASQTAARATRPAERAAPARPEGPGKAVRDFRESLARGIVRPTNVVIVSRQRIEEVMDEAAKRGRMTVDDAQRLADTLYRRARRETTDVVKDLEQLVGRGRGQFEQRTETARKRGGGAAGRARKQVEDATARVRRGADPALAQVDRARRAAGVGPSFPITGYDDLTAAQVQARLSDLSAAELRKVRDYEKRNANRKSVLGAINQKLG